MYNQTNEKMGGGGPLQLARVLAADGVMGSHRSGGTAITSMTLSCFRVRRLRRPPASRTSLLAET